MRVALDAGALSRSVARLIMAKPFYGFLLSQFKRQREPGLVGGVGLRIDSGGNPVLVFDEANMVAPLDGGPVLDIRQGVRAWTDYELDAVLEHVCLHVLHHHATRRDHRHPLTWGIAADLAINPLITGLPSHAVLPGTLGFEQGLTAEAYYELLPKMDGCPACGGAAPRQEETPSPERNHDEDQEDVDSPGQHASAAGGSGCPACGGINIDDHQGWGRGEAPPPDLSESFIKQAVAKAWNRASSHGRNQGYLPAGIVEKIEELLAAKPYDWRPLLRRFCHGALKRGRRSTIFRHHRRYGPLFPGRRPRRAGKIAILADTSASVDAEELGQEWVEMREIVRHVQGFVMEADAAVQDIYEVKRTTPLPAFKGRGGTVFDQAFQLINDPASLDVHERQGLLVGVEALIILTDGGVCVPQECPVRVPVMWAILPGGRKPCSWGDTIYIGDWDELPAEDGA